MYVYTKRVTTHRAIIYQCEALIASKGGKEFQVRVAFSISRPAHACTRPILCLSNQPTTRTTHWPSSTHVPNALPHEKRNGPPMQQVTIILDRNGTSKQNQDPDMMKLFFALCTSPPPFWAP